MDMQKKVDSCKADIQRMTRELGPIEVRVSLSLSSILPLRVWVLPHWCACLYVCVCVCVQERKQEMDEMYTEAEAMKTRIGELYICCKLL